MNMAKTSAEYPPISLEDISFSRRGAWMSISPLIAKFHAYDMDRYFLKCHHHDTKPVLEITPTIKGLPAKIRPVARPHTLKWTGEDDAEMEIIFDTSKSIRIRGRGFGLKLTPYLRTEIYSTEQTSGTGRFATFNVLPMQRKFQVECLKGQMHWSSQRENETGKEFELELTVKGDEWEISLDIFTSVCPTRQKIPFEESRDAVEEEFSRWLAHCPQCAPEFDKARALAAYITWSAVVEPHGLLKRDTMFMSKNYMAKIWSWDHCFNALALSPNHSDLAWDQMLVVADEQDEFGCYPDAYNDTSLIYNYTKPPVHGWALQEMVKRLKPRADDTRLHSLFTSIERWTDFWLDHRRLPGAELAHYLHGYDSGWDNSTMFDQTVPLIGPDLNSFLIVQMDCLSEVARFMGDTDKSVLWQEKADRLYKALITELWDGEKFIARGAARGESVTSDSLIYHLPILLGKRLPPDIRAKLVRHIERFKTPYGLATEHPTSDKFMDDGYWRGPIWGPSTYLIFSGLLRSGYPELARDIAERFCGMCRDHDFAENHHALTGERLRDRGFTWTASTFLLMAEHLNQ